MKLDIYIVEYYNEQEHKTYFGSIVKFPHETKDEFSNRCDVRLSDIQAEAAELGRTIWFENELRPTK